MFFHAKTKFHKEIAYDNDKDCLYADFSYKHSISIRIYFKTYYITAIHQVMFNQLNLIVNISNYELSKILFYHGDNDFYKFFLSYIGERFSDTELDNLNLLLNHYKKDINHIYKFFFGILVIYMFKKKIEYNHNKSIHSIKFLYSNLYMIEFVIDVSYVNTNYIYANLISCESDFPFYYHGNNDFDIFFLSHICQPFSDEDLLHFQNILNYYKSDIKCIYKMYHGI